MKNQIKTLWKKYVLIEVPLSSSKDEIKDCYIKQKTNKDWTLYSEREFIETLFCTRFNYFMAVFSVLVLAIIENKLSWPFLFLVALILTLMVFSTYRIYTKLIIILKMLYQLEDYHVFNLVKKNISSLNNKFSWPVNCVIGVIIPFFIILFAWIFLFYYIIM